MAKTTAVLLATLLATLTLACGGSSSSPGEDPCAGTTCADPHPLGWGGIAPEGTSLHGNAVRAGDGTCGRCHTQTTGGNSGQLDGVKNGDAHDGLICTHCHLSSSPGQVLFVAGKIHVDGWGAGWSAERRAHEVAKDELAPLRGGVHAGCLSCHLGG